MEDLCRNWNTSQGQVAEEGSSLFWEIGLHKRSGVAASLSRDQSTLAEFHTEPGPLADSKATAREVLTPVIQSCPTLCDLMDCPWNSPGKNTGGGCHFLLQGIFPTQGLNPSLLHCRQILYHLSHQKRYCKTSSQVPGLLSRATSQHSGECWLLALGCCLVTRHTGSSRGCRSEGTPTKRCRLIGRCPLLTVSPEELAPSRVPTSQTLECDNPLGFLIAIKCEFNLKQINFLFCSQVSKWTPSSASSVVLVLLLLVRVLTPALPLYRPTVQWWEQERPSKQTNAWN